MATKTKTQQGRAMTAERWHDLQGLFKVLANETRLRMLSELESAGELCVGELAEAIGMAPQAVSNQLQRLVDRRIVAARRDGNYVHYRIVDPCVSGLLELGTCLITATKVLPPAR